MSDIERGQVISSAAEVYEEFFLPALFEQWADTMVTAAHMKPHQRILDVACGTGVLARAAAEQVGADGHVVGLDINQGMLVVAQRQAPQIQWRHGRAEALPFDTDSFDVVVSQFGLMFFEDRRAAICEMARVLKPNGRLAVAVWASLDMTPGYAAAAEMLRRLFGEQAADSLRIPYILGDVQELVALFDGTELQNVEVNTYSGTVRYPSIEAWMYTDVKGWTLADMIDEAQYQMLLQEAEVVLKPFVNGDGTVSFSSPAHIVTAVKG